MLVDPVTSTEDLLRRMDTIDAALPATDGVACFNRMYRLVTQAVQQQLGAGAFQDQAWMTDLDVVFANLYLTAIARPDLAPGSWLALIERRSNPHITPLQFALAGMNAHINHDLPLAVVTTCADLGTTPDPHHADFERINTLLAEVEPVIRKSFEDQLLVLSDQMVPGLQDVVANFSMARARETAWANAETMWLLRQYAPDRLAAYETGLDHLVGFAGRGLLVPLLP